MSIYEAQSSEPHRKSIGFTVLRAHGLPSGRAFGTFVTVTLGEEVFRTTAVSGESPTWNQSHTFYKVSAPDFTIGIYRADSTGTHNLLGAVKYRFTNAQPQVLNRMIKPDKEDPVNIKFRVQGSGPGSNVGGLSTDALSLTDIVINSISEYPILPTNLYVRFLVEGVIWDWTEVVTHHLSDSAWKSDAEILVPSDVLFIIEAMFDGSEQEGKCVGVLELRFSRPIGPQRIKETLNKVSDDSPLLELCLTVDSIDAHAGARSIGDQGSPPLKVPVEETVNPSQTDAYLPTHPSPGILDMQLDMEGPDDESLETDKDSLPLRDPKNNKLNAFGDLLLKGFLSERKLADLDLAISAYEGALQVASDDDPQQITYMSNLSRSLLHRFQVLGEVTDIEMAIDTLKACINIAPDDHPNLAMLFNDLGTSFMYRFKCLGELADIDGSVSAKEEALRHVPDGHPSKSKSLSNLGNSLILRFRRLGNLPDLERAVSAHESAIQLVDDDNPGKPTYLNHLGHALCRRFKRLGEHRDLEKGVSFLKLALQLTSATHPDRFHHLNTLGDLLRNRFQSLGKLSDLETAISVQESAIELIPANHPAKAAYLKNLGISLCHHFEHLGNFSNLEKAISIQESALQCIPEGHYDKPVYLHVLGISYMRRFAHLGKLPDLERAISVQSLAVQLTPDDQPIKLNRLNDLGISLWRRFDHLGELADLEKAISVHKSAGELIPDVHPDRPSHLNSLAVSLRHRFEHSGDITDLTDAISLHELAVQLTPDNYTQKPIFLTNLGSCFLERFNELSEVSDLTQAISAQESALILAPGSHSRKLFLLSNLSRLFQSRFKHLGEQSDIEKAISLTEPAIQLTPKGHPDKPMFLEVLGTSFFLRFRHLNESPDLDKAITYFSQAAQSSGRAFTQFRAAHKWATSVVLSGSDPTHAYRCAMDLLHRVAWLGLTVKTRHRLLIEIGKVVHDAAAAAISSNQYETAVEWLEQGRSIVWGQLLQLRHPFDELQLKYPDLAEQLLQISRKLEHASGREDLTSTDANNMSLEEAAQIHHELALEWDRLLASVRVLPGFEHFLRPKNISELRLAAKAGPVVLLNIEESRCDALILKSEEGQIIHIPLRKLTYGKVKDLQRLFRRLQSSKLIRSDIDRDAVFEKEIPLSSYEDVLEDLWISIVKPVLVGLALPIPKNGNLPRIWWCPTGSFAFLPLHAAGIYGAAGPKISDFVISSYTPTITALLEKPPPRSKIPFKLLAVAQPDTPGQVPIPNTTKEVKHIRDRAATTALDIEFLKGPQATVDKVFKSMETCNWVHLACHGTQDVRNPTKSALLLSDSKLELSSIIKANLPHAEFAFLSACKTAMGDTSLEEEAVHLAAGMLLAGYKSVIATTSAIRDRDAPVVADEVYRELFRDTRPDYKRAAYALHHAIQRLRLSGASFASWVPFIHVGM